MKAIYKGKNNHRFVNGHEYEVNEEKRLYGYVVTVKYDYTADKKMSKIESYHGVTGVNNDWQFI